MKLTPIVLVAIGLFVLAGCASTPEPSEFSVRMGMSREDLRRHFGEPSRIEHTAAGGEDWYYRFVGWRTEPTESSGTSYENGQTTSYASASWSFSKIDEEHPIHLSADGHVIDPLPEGKVVRN